MALHRFDVALLPDSGLLEDVSINTWHFDKLIAPATDYDNVRDMLQDFYIALQTYYSSDKLQTTAGIRAYDLADAEPRVPVYESTITWVPGGGAQLPAEVAVCLTFRSEYESGAEKSRYRNRKYLGPLATNANDNGMVDAAMVTAVVDAAVELAQASDASTTWKWRQFSPFDGVDREIVGGWVDNAFDTQRRRGVDATNRELWSENAGSGGIP